MPQQQQYGQYQPQRNQYQQNQFMPQQQQYGQYQPQPAARLRTQGPESMMPRLMTQGPASMMQPQRMSNQFNPNNAFGGY